MKHKIGAHLSSSGGHYKALNSIISKGGNCLQLFSSSPRTWQTANIDSSDILRFRELKNELKIDPIYFHALYLVNLADPGQTGNKSVEAIIHELQLAFKMGIKGSIIHTGSFKNKNKSLSCREEENFHILISNIRKILDQTPKEGLLILENAGNRKIGQTIDQLAEIIEEVQDDRVRVCLDTCHLHAAGYDLNQPESFEIFLQEFDKKIKLSKLEVVHMNDSQDELNALRDRHANIGEGHVGTAVFKNFLNHPKTKSIPFILETPGFDNNGPDKKNIDILKSLID